MISTLLEHEIPSMGQIATRAVGIPGVRVMTRISPVAWRALAALFVLLVVLTTYLEQPDGPFRVGSDTWVYAAAGERLNAGHPLYALDAGDRPVPLHPPYWTVPLLSPPPIAVLWRPLAAIGPTGWLLWWIGGVACVLWMGATVLYRGNALGILVLIAATPALTQTMLAGNANAYLTPLVFAAWLFRSKAGFVGAVVALATAVKVAPLLLALWLIGTARWRALGWMILTGGALFVVAVVGAGHESFTAWFASLPHQAPSPGSLASITGLTPVTIVVVTAAVAGASIGLLNSLARTKAARGRADTASFCVAICASVAATPALWFSANSLLGAAAAPSIPSPCAPEAPVPGGDSGRSHLKRLMPSRDRGR